jgi:hypothetical protein
VVARAIGVGMDRIEILGPDGPVAAARARGESAEISAEIAPAESMWLAAAVRGGLHPLAVGGRPTIYAHTSPVWVEVDGRPVARPADARWCLTWLDGLERLIRTDGRFSTADRLVKVIEVIARARAFYTGISGSA